MTEPEPLSPGKQTLLRALDQIEEIEAEDDGHVTHLAVAYSVQHSPEDGDGYTTMGWSATPGDAAFVTAALLNEAGRLVQQSWEESHTLDEEDEDED